MNSQLNSDNVEGRNLLFNNGNLNYNEDPRKETFFNFLKWFLCPTFRFISLTFILTIANILYFIFSLTKGVKVSLPTNSSTLSLLAVDENNFKTLGSLVNIIN